MIKWLIIILLAVPRVIYSEIALLIMNSNKEKYSLEKRYNVVRNTCRWICKLTRTKFNITNEEVISNYSEKGRLFVSNHLSVYDAITMVALSKKPLIFISKKENSKVPFLTTHMKAIDTICIDRESVKQSLKVCKDAGIKVKEGHDIVLYAEGTRSKDGNVAPFKAALPTIVHYCESDIVLVCIHNSKEPLKFRVITYPKEYVNIKFFNPLPYTYYLENRKEFSVLTHDLIQEQVDIYKKGEK